MKKQSSLAKKQTKNSEDRFQTRRQFVSQSLKGVTVACACAGLPVLTACGGDDTNPAGNSEPRSFSVDLTEPRYEALQEVGGTVTLAAGDISGLPSNGVFLIRTSDAAITVLDRTCTHQQCQVGVFSGTTATCACHGSRYSASGAVTRGPATQSLTSYSSNLNGNTLEFTV